VQSLCSYWPQNWRTDGLYSRSKLSVACKRCSQAPSSTEKAGSGFLKCRWSLAARCWCRQLASLAQSWATIEPNRGDSESYLCLLETQAEHSHFFWEPQSHGPWSYSGSHTVGKESKRQCRWSSVYFIFARSHRASFWSLFKFSGDPRVHLCELHIWRTSNFQIWSLAFFYCFLSQNLSWTHSKRLGLGHDPPHIEYWCSPCFSPNT